MKSLKNQLINAFEDRYFKGKNNIYMGFNNTSIQDILAYLWDYFRRLSGLELEEVEKLFSNSNNPSTLFSTFTRNIEEVIDIAEVACFL